MRVLNDTAIVAGNTGSVEGGTLTFGGLGDWQIVDVTFPTPFQNVGQIVIIASPVISGWNPDSPGPAPVCVTTDVTHEGFVLRARNSNKEGGQATINWMATAERPSTVPPKAWRMGRTPPQAYSPNGGPRPRNLEWTGKHGR